MSSLIGKTIDTYEVYSVLGQGGMGIVYLAKDTTLDREVALKLMDAGLTRDESFLKRFQSEAKALAKLQNPNIVSIYALRETEEGLCIVMEYVQGNTLADQLREQGTLSIDRTVRIFKQILHAFDHAHSAGIIHRDIKPGNILLTPGDIVKVTDFGLAKIQAANQATMTMGTGGTLYYMSPEQVRGLANVDKRGDIYSLGITLYETLTGAVPFESQTDFTIRQAIVEGNIPSPEVYLPTLPKGLKQVIMKSIARLPDDRYQTASEMWIALDAATAEKPVTKIGLRQFERTTSTAAPAKTSSGNMVKIIGGVAAAIVLTVALYFQFFSADQHKLSITSQPAGALVTINGKYTGVTPLKNVTLDAGGIGISLSLTGFQPVDTNISLSSNRALEFMLTPEKIEAEKVMQSISTEPVAEEPQRTSPDVKQVPPQNNTQSGATGVLSISVVPASDITINGESRKADVSQSASFTVPSGSVGLSIKNAQYGTQRERVTVEAGKTLNLTYYWERRIIIGVRPTFANITVNNESIGVADLKDITRGPGRYKITVSKPLWEIERIELNNTPVSNGDIVITAGFGDKANKLKFYLKEINKGE